MLKQTAPHRSSNLLSFINNVTKQNTAATKALQGSNNSTTITFNNHLKHTQLYSNLTALLVAKDSAISTNWTEPIFCCKAPIICPSQSRTTTPTPSKPGFYKERFVEVHFVMILRGRRPTHLGNIIVIITKWTLTHLSLQKQGHQYLQQVAETLYLFLFLSIEFIWK